jgi:hypothetical protein
MTKKDFTFIANVLNHCINKDYFMNNYVEDIIESFAKELAKTSEQFDREKFLKACYK